MSFKKFLVTGSLAAMLAAGARAAEPISPAQFEPLRTLIAPKPDEERWASVPWMASLWAARDRAAREGKPILLWEMDGHPLGCV